MKRPNLLRVYGADVNYDCDQVAVIYDVNGRRYVVNYYHADGRVATVLLTTRKRCAVQCARTIVRCGGYNAAAVRVLTR